MNCTILVIKFILRIAAINNTKHALFYCIRTLASMLIIFVFGQSLHAETFRGKILRTNDVISIYDNKSHKKFSLNFKSEIPSLQVKRLSDGDFAAVTASVNSTSNNSLDVVSIDYVGLSVLIGTWKSSDGLCYVFSGYTSFTVYAPQQNNDCRSLGPTIPTVKYSYFINPDVSDWNMLISSKDHELYGQLKIVTTKNIEIQLFDSRTDAILGTIVLRR